MKIKKEEIQEIKIIKQMIGIEQPRQQQRTTTRVQQPSTATTTRQETTTKNQQPQAVKP